MAEVYPLIAPKARRLFHKMNLHGGEEAWEELTQVAYGVAWKRWLDTADDPSRRLAPGPLAYFSVVQARRGYSVCGRRYGKSIDGRAGRLRGSVRFTIADYRDLPIQDTVPSLQRKIDLHHWLETLRVKLLRVAIVLMQTGADPRRGYRGGKVRLWERVSLAEESGRTAACRRIGVSIHTLRRYRRRLRDSWRAFCR